MSEGRVVSEEISVEVFCAEQSKSDRRVETLGAFHKSELKQQHTQDTRAAFAARYAEFCIQPVK
jgi:hypothetical protein